MVEIPDIPLTRRNALKKMVATGAVAGAAWVIPEMTVGQWAGGETLSSGPTALNGPIPPDAAPIPPAPHSTQTPQHSANPLAFTGLNIQAMTEAGGAAIIGGWAMHHWAARNPPAKVVGDVAEDSVT